MPKVTKKSIFHLLQNLKAYRSLIFVAFAGSSGDEFVDLNQAIAVRAKTEYNMTYPVGVQVGTLPLDEHFSSRCDQLINSYYSMLSHYLMVTWSNFYSTDSCHTHTGTEERETAHSRKPITWPWNYKRAYCIPLECVMGKAVVRDVLRFSHWTFMPCKLPIQWWNSLQSWWERWTKMAVWAAAAA